MEMAQADAAPHFFGWRGAKRFNYAAVGSFFVAPGGEDVRRLIKFSTVDSAFLQANQNRDDSVEVCFETLCKSK
jgi:hypothetical protein